MTIAFRYLPYLVQHKVMDQMDLFDIFSIYSISKKSQALAKSYFNRHNFELRYFVSQDQFWIHRDRTPKHYGCHSDHVYIVPRNGFEVVKNPILFTQSSDSFTTSSSYSEDTNESRQKMLKLVKELFPRLHLYSKFSYLNLAGFLNKMNFVRSFNIPLNKVQIGSPGKVNDDELMEAVLEQCSDVKNLIIHYSSRSLFQYDFRTHAPFKFDLFELNGADWVTKYHLINLFMSCKKVILISQEAFSGMKYTDQELTEICEKWLAAPEMQHLEIKKTETFFEGVGKLPGALPVRQLTVADYYGRKESVTFFSKQCYKVEKADGTPAVVYRERFSGGIYFRTEFEDAVIGEGV